jgi:O-6-methylguanine DNA methyltransferase
MGSTDPTKIRPAAIAPEAVSLLDFRGGPASHLGLYAVSHVAAGCVRIETVGDERELEAMAQATSIEVRPLPGPLHLLARFAGGEPVDVAHVPVVLHGPPFFVKIWAALCGVRRGEVCTYAHLARAVRSPRAMRAVGQAMAKNPLPLAVPCHRVIADHARLGGYTGGTDRKRALLALEGVDVDGDTVRPGQLELLDHSPRSR